MNHREKRNVQINLKRVINNHVFNPQKFSKPIFKSKYNKRHSYTTSVTNNNSSVIDDNYKLKSVTISKASDSKCYTSLLYQYEVLFDKTFLKIIGIDYSMAHFDVLSNGEFLEYPKYLLKNKEKEI